MLKTTDSFAKATGFRRSEDVFTDVLRALRISGGVLLREAYQPPWAVKVPAAEELATLLGAGAGERVVAFHLVEFGQCEIKPEGGEPVLLKAGEMAICFGGEAHRISQGRAAKPLAIEDLLDGRRHMQCAAPGSPAAATSLLCGVFTLRHTDYNPLLTALPRLLHASLSRAGEMHNLAGAARLMAEEIDRKSPGSAYVVERLLEVLCAEAIRAHLETVSPAEAGWFRGLKDQIVGRAIAAIHAAPGDAWSVQRLADEVAVSPSRFAARFVEATGESPMAYVAKWRMSVACRRLTRSRQAIEQIASEVGYESVAAFNRAFRKHLGLPPAAWRSRVK